MEYTIYWSAATRRCFGGRSIDDPSGAVPANTGLCTYPYAPLNTRGAYGGLYRPGIWGCASGPPKMGVLILGVVILVVMMLG